MPNFFLCITYLVKPILVSGAIYSAQTGSTPKPKLTMYQRQPKNLDLAHNCWQLVVGMANTCQTCQLSIYVGQIWWQVVGLGLGLGYVHKEL